MKEEVSLDLRNFIYIIKKRRKLIFLITILSAIISGILSFYVIIPTYEAKATIVVGKANAGTNEKLKYEYYDVIMFQNLIKTYAEIAKSTAVAENASVRLKDGSVKDILSNLTVTPKEDTQLIEFKVQNSDPEKAYLMLKAVCNAFIEEGESIYPGQNIQVIDNAKIAEDPIRPRKLLNITMAFFIGLFASVGLAFLLEYMDNTLKTEQDIGECLCLPVIGIIPKDSYK